MSSAKDGWSTSNCFAPSKECDCKFDTGGALRKGDYKFLWTGNGHSSSAPGSTKQGVPKGFTPSTTDTVPEPFTFKSETGLYLFDIRNDPTESHNLASQETARLEELISLRDVHMAAETTVASLSWRWGSRSFDEIKNGCRGP